VRLPLAVCLITQIFFLQVSSDDLGRAEEILADDLENIKGMLAEVVLEPTL
jgi:hypothetical protein